MTGTVYLVGAGPGDPKLLTRRGWELLQSCDCIVYDALIGQELLDLTRRDAELLFVGKRAGQHSMTQDEINALLVERAQTGKSVCRLKGGDPFVFGRGGEEALFCRAHNVAFEIVPGVSSSIAAPAYAGIPVTQRGVAASFAVVTGHTKDDDAPPESLPVADTLVFLMGVRALPKIVRALLARGESPDKPVALVRWGTTTQQKVVTGTLQTIEAEVERAQLKPPALIVVGDVVSLRDELRWFDNPQQRPLWGQTVVVTRAREQASSLVEGLRDKGARVIECPTIRVEALDNEETRQTLQFAFGDLFENCCDWIVFTSANGVHAFWQALRNGEHKLDARVFGRAQIAAIGPATASALEVRGLHADLVPQSSVSEAVAEELLERGAGNENVLIVRALEGRDVIETKLREAGAHVDVAPVYQTVPDNQNAPQVRELLQHGEIHWVTFSSSSTVRNFLDAVGAEVVHAARNSFRVACIGPVTAQTARELGLEPDVVADNASVDALVAAITKTI